MIFKNKKCKSNLEFKKIHKNQWKQFIHKIGNFKEMFKKYINIKKMLKTLFKINHKNLDNNKKLLEKEFFI